MTDYALLYEKIVIAAWGKSGRGEDPYGLGDANTMDIVGEELIGKDAERLKDGLYYALTKVADKHRGKAEHPFIIAMGRRTAKANTR